MYYTGFDNPTPETIHTEIADTKIVAVDIENISLKDSTTLGIGIGLSDKKAVYFTPDEFSTPYSVIQDPTKLKLYHNGMFDLAHLPNPDTTNIGDTMLMAKLFGFPLNLQGLVFSFWARNYAYHKVDRMGEVLKEHGVKTCDLLPADRLAQKCMDDCMGTYAVYQYMLPDMTPAYWDAYNVDVQIMPILIKMSKRGIKLDQNRVRELAQHYEEKVSYYEEICRRIGLNNPNSPKQVATIIANRGVLFPKKVKGKWGYSTGKDDLKYINDFVAQLILLYRHDKYRLSHYVQPYIDQERAYTHFHLLASTSRMSSTGTDENDIDRNLMNIPKGQDRSIYIPDNGTFTCADASQMQLRILAYLSDDNEMTRIYDEDGDIHQETANYLDMPRNKLVKAVNFGMVFGATAQTLMDTANDDGVTVSDIHIAERLMDGWSRKYSGAWDWIKSQQVDGLKHGFVYTSFGRKLYITKERGYAHARRCAVNFPIQGTEAEIIKRWLIDCDKRNDLTLAHIIHDEGIFDGYYTDIPDINDYAPFNCPMNLDYKERWS